MIEDIRRLDGFVIAAHPASAKPELRWTDWSLPVDGLEWLNGDSEWRDESAFSLVRALLTYPGRGRESLATLLDHPAELMQRWDLLSAGRRVVAVAAADAHARIGLRNLGEPYDRKALLPLPSYETAVQHLLHRLARRRVDRQRVRRCARRYSTPSGGASVYSTIDALAGPGALSFAAVDRTVLRARIHAQPDARIVLFKDGHELKTALEGALEHDATKEPGVYRVEVQLTGCARGAAGPVDRFQRDLHRPASGTENRQLPGRGGPPSSGSSTVMAPPPIGQWSRGRSRLAPSIDWGPCLERSWDSDSR